MNDIKKYALIGIGGLISLYVITKMFKTAKISDAVDNIADADIKRVPPTISDSQAVLDANALYNAMEGWGTNDSVIKDILVSRPYNAGDYALIAKKFGVRDNKNIWDWLRAELSNYWFQAVTLNEVLNHLTALGVTVS